MEKQSQIEQAEARVRELSSVEAVLGDKVELEEPWLPEPAQRTEKNRSLKA